MVRRRAGGLQEEYIFPSDVFFNFHKRLTIREWLDGGFPESDADVRTNRLRQRLVGSAAKNLHDDALVWLKTKIHRKGGESRADSSNRLAERKVKLGRRN